MRLVIAGKDRTSDLGQAMAARAARHQGALSAWSPRDSALFLRESRDSSDYFDQFWRLMRLHHSVSTDFFHIPARPGRAGNLTRQIKKVLWRVLRYQHDHVTFQQNIINELVTSAAEFQQAIARKQVADLERKVRRLEAGLKALESKLGPGKESA
mgnify:CR=1 FL=1